MKIDLTVLKTVEREREISSDALIHIIEQAILQAHLRSARSTTRRPRSPASRSTARAAR